ncbi:MAG: glycosyltransferase family 2 protein [Planctomycetota bacterium]|jgi:GT2 family glycosyltransferase
MPRFSIITATHGRPAELREALVSALQQDCSDFEHLVVDDASPDDAATRVIAELDDPRLRLLRLDESRGPAGARNAAVREARGKLLAILDDDDLMLPGRLRAAAERFDARPDLVLVASTFKAIDADGHEHATVHPPTDEGRLREILPHHNPVCHSTCTVRADVLRDLGGYREALRYSHDYDMVLRIAEKGGVAVLPEPLGLYRFHTKNISAARCFLQGAYAAIAQECARRRARGEPERLEELVAAVPPPNGRADVARARVHYQIGEWKFRDGKVKEARPHLRIALGAEPLRPLCLGLTVAAYTPAWLRRWLGPAARRLVALRYASWR